MIEQYREEFKCEEPKPDTEQPVAPADTPPVILPPTNPKWPEFLRKWGYPIPDARTRSVVVEYTDNSKECHLDIDPRAPFLTNGVRAALDFISFKELRSRLGTLKLKLKMQVLK